MTGKYHDLNRFSQPPCVKLREVKSPARPDDPLAQPTRARLFELLCELRRPASTEELARRLKLHPNGIRLHLDRLCATGLVARQQDRRPRGRPRDVWLISPGARPGGAPPTAYAHLARWLARAIKPGKTSVRGVESTGREVGRELAAHGPGSAETKMHAALAALGFQPRRESHEPGRLTYRLCNCPYREAVNENPEVVCALHRGMTRGLLDGLDPTGTLTSFVPRDPSRAGCLIELGGRIAAEGLERLER